MSGSTVFFKSSFVVNRKKIRFLNIVPPFTKNILSFEFEIYGTDDTRIEGKTDCKKGCTGIISFNANIGETYFVKLIAKYENRTVDYCLFYKMEDDFEKEIESEEDDEEEEEEDEEKKDDEIEDVEVDDIDENKIREYIKSRTPNSGLETENDPDIDGL